MCMSKFWPFIYALAITKCVGLGRVPTAGAPGKFGGRDRWRNRPTNGPVNGLRCGAGPLGDATSFFPRAYPRWVFCVSWTVVVVVVVLVPWGRFACSNMRLLQFRTRGEQSSTSEPFRSISVLMTWGGGGSPESPRQGPWPALLLGDGLDRAAKSNNNNENNEEGNKTGNKARVQARSVAHVTF